MSVLCVQRRPHRAGAQTCLARLLRHAGLREWQPHLVCSLAGWLTDQCQILSVPCCIEPFPSSRSLAARLYRNTAFARRVRDRLGPTANLQIVQANDHLEGLLALALARTLGARAAMLLRSPGMTRADYFKYRCQDFDFVAAVGDELRARAAGWDPARTVHLIHDGIAPSEFAAPRPLAAEFPRQLLIVGSALDWKGWADLTDALAELENDPAWPALELDFTGTEPDRQKNDLRLARLRRTRCRFLGRVEKFRELVLGYDLVINPSRMESFGMAAVEVVALGVPLVSSRTGIIEQVITQPEFLFQPHQPGDLAQTLRHLQRHWRVTPFDASGAQRRIREHFLIDHTVEKLTAAYRQLLGDR